MRYAFQTVLLTLLLWTSASAAELPGTPLDSDEDTDTPDTGTPDTPDDEFEELLPELLTPTFSIAGPRARTPHAGPPSHRVTTRDRAERPGNTWDGLMEDNPGVRTRSLGPAPERPVIRGFDGERILVLEDGQRMGDVSGTAHDHAIAIDPLSVVEAEVIRGPISVLYGGNAIGGVVDLRRASLLDMWPDGAALTVRTTASSVDIGAGGHVRGAYGAEAYAVALRASGRTAGDIRTAEGVLDDTASRAGELGADLAWRLGGASGELRAAWRGHLYGLPEGGDEDGDEDDGEERVELRMQRLRFSHELVWQLRGDRHRLRHVTAVTLYAHDEVEIETAPDGSEDEELELRFDVLSHSQRLELHTSAEEGVLADRTLGLDADVQSVRIAGEEVLTPDALRTRAGVFGVQELRISDAVRLPLGLRLELTHVDTTANARFNRDAGNLPSSPRTFPDLAASVGAVFTPVRELSVGVQASRAFRAPLVEELYSDAPHLGANAYEIGDPDLASEVVHGGDLWARLDVGPVRLDVSAFAAQVEDYIVRAPTPDIDVDSGLRIFRYGSTRAVLFGGEAGAEVKLPVDLEVRVSADVVQGSAGSLDGEPLPAMPPPAGTVRLGWSPNRTFVRVRTSATAAQNRTAPDEEPTDGHVLLGGEVGQRFEVIGGWFTAVLRVDNALDVAWRDHLSQVERRGAGMPGRNVQFALSGEW